MRVADYVHGVGSSHSGGRPRLGIYRPPEPESGESRHLGGSLLGLDSADPSTSGDPVPLEVILREAVRRQREAERVRAEASLTGEQFRRGVGHRSDSTSRARLSYARVVWGVSAAGDMGGLMPDEVHTTPSRSGRVPAAAKPSLARCRAAPRPVVVAVACLVTIGLTISVLVGLEATGWVRVASWAFAWTAALILASSMACLVHETYVDRLVGGGGIPGWLHLSERLRSYLANEDFPGDDPGSTSRATPQALGGGDGGR